MEVSKKDWKLFRACIGEWQEAYMERLTKEYIDLLSGDENASDKFWKLEERIKKDKKHPGVMLELSKENMIFDIVALINRDVITVVDCQTAHCGRYIPHFDFGAKPSPIVPYRHLPQSLSGMTADCRSLV